MTPQIFGITCILRQQGSTFQMQFKTAAAAIKAFNMLQPDAHVVPDVGVIVTDDFGTSVSVRPEDVLAVLTDDLRQRLELSNDMQLMQHHAQARLNAAIARDPIINGTIVMPSGPAMAGHAARRN